MALSKATPLATVSVAARRQRLVARHHLDGSAPDVATVLRSVVGLHSSDPATPHLSTLARMHNTYAPRFSDDGFGPLASALHIERRGWRLHAMRRTLFIIDLLDADAVHGGAARDVAKREHRKLASWVADSEADIPAIVAATAMVLDTLATQGPLSVRELVAAVPALGVKVTVGSGRWTAQQSVASRVLLVLALDGLITRADPVGTWLSGQYRWASSSAWFGDQANLTTDPGHAADSSTEHDLRQALVARYLTACGPATVSDVAWWTGWSATKAKAALADCKAVAVNLEGCATDGYVMPDDPLVAGASDRADLDGVSSNGPSVALLPGLDPTPMSYRERDWYLGSHAPALFDRNGNIGPTIWVDGRIVGGWGQRANGHVAIELLESVGRSIERKIQDGAQTLTEALQPTVVTPRFRTPLERSLADR